ncbi:MAG: hypothetical protein HY225_02850 [Candidatus Vogelbacteria bacterium]|nr:hypothetical protein [Candidatus Vogelbacteria bacterium]
MNLKELFKKIKTRVSLYILAGIIAALLIFRAGMSVGFHQASFSYHFGDRYYQSFGRMRGGNFRGLGEEFGDTYGTSGKIIKITLPKIIIESQDNSEKVVTVEDSTTTSTIIRSQRDSIKSSDLRVGDNIIVLGSPDDNAEINARLIRVIPTR